LIGTKVSGILEIAIDSDKAKGQFHAIHAMVSEQNESSVFSANGGNESLCCCYVRKNDSGKAKGQSHATASEQNEIGVFGAKGGNETPLLLLRILPLSTLPLAAYDSSKQSQSNQKPYARPCS